MARIFTTLMRENALLGQEKAILTRKNGSLKVENKKLRDDNTRLKSGYTENQLKWLLSNEAIERLSELTIQFSKDKTTLMKEWRKEIDRKN